MPRTICESNRVEIGTLLTLQLYPLLVAPCLVHVSGTQSKENSLESARHLAKMRVSCLCLYVVSVLSHRAVLNNRVVLQYYYY